MSSTVLLQIFLYANVFIIGVLTTIGVQHAYAHFKPKPRKTDKPERPDNRLPSEVREELLERSKGNFETVLSRSADELQHSLDETGDQLNKALNKLGTAMVGNELEHYHANLEQIRKQAEATLNGAQTELAQHQAELRAKLAEAVEAEKAQQLQQLAAEQDRLIKQLDTKLNGAVTAFLMEAMQHNVDLGAQAPYLASLLEEHKEELKREIKA